MKKIVRLTESDLTIIVRRVIVENKKQNNNRYYSNRNLRRLSKTPVIMVESIEQYRPFILNEGLFDTFTDKISSALDGMSKFFKEKANKLKDNVEDYFDKSLKDITLDDIKTALKNEVIPNSEVNENKDMDFADKYAKSDIGSEGLFHPVKDKSRILQRVFNFFQTVFGINLFSFGTIGTVITWALGSTVPIPGSMALSIIAIGFMLVIRRLAAAASNHIKESYRPYRRY
jgi:hypothetical protein